MRVDHASANALFTRPATDAARPPHGVARGRADGPAGVGPAFVPPGHRAPDAPVTAAPPETANATGPALTLDGLVDAWGETDSPYDIVRDGVVDVHDLVRFILDWPNAAPAPVAPPADLADPDAIAPEGAPAAGGPDALDAAGAAEDREPVQEPMTLQGLIDHWGREDSPYDLDGNRTVDVHDLVQFILNNHWPMPEGTANAEAPADRPDAGPVRAATDSLLSRLAGAGFTDRLPANVGELIDATAKSDADKRAVASDLARAYPKGIGLSLRA